MTHLSAPSTAHSRPERGAALVTIAVIVGVIIVIGAILGSSYNGLVKKRNAVEQQFAQIDVQLQRRYDLIPNLVNAVRGALQQEQAVFGEIAEARTRYAGSPSPENANQVESALGRLLVIMEQYPQLQSNQNIRDLQVQLEGTENRIAQERRLYNQTATDYRNSTETFPRNLVAGLFGFEAEPLLVAPEQAQDAPTVDLNVTSTTAAPAATTAP